MSRRRKTTIERIPDGWVIETQTRVHGRWLTPGTEFKVAGERGRFRFTRIVETDSSTWIDARDKDGRFRSFRTDRVRTVHIKKQMRGAA